MIISPSHSVWLIPNLNMMILQDLTPCQVTLCGIEMISKGAYNRSMRSQSKVTY